MAVVCGGQQGVGRQVVAVVRSSKMGAVVPLGFGAQGLGFGIWGLGFRVWGKGFFSDRGRGPCRDPGAEVQSGAAGSQPPQAGGPIRNLEL